MFSRKNRLYKDKDIKTVFAKGRGFFNPYFLVKKLNILEEKKFTVVISTKVSKKAVVRNRIKRILRENIRLNIEDLPNGYYIFTVKPQISKLPEAEITPEFLKVLKKLK